jgi:pimeloyl-ACP methyl ester carboxylesterase
MPGAQKAPLRALRSTCDIFGAENDSLKLIGPELEKATAQALIVWGRQDGVIPTDYAYLAKEKRPNSQLRILEQCRHKPNFKKPEKFNKLVVYFLCAPKAPNP